MIKDIFNKVQQTTPLVHCITNYVTVNDCANILLAAGGSPIMSDEINDVEDITSICNALVLNIGTLNERTVQSMLAAGKRANELNHPIVLDPVGAGASKMRTETAAKLLSELKISVIRGNISEIKALASGTATSRGVDASEADALNAENQQEVIDFIKKLAISTNAIVVVTGKTDIISDGKTTYLIHNGHAMMSKITGSGCMLTCLVAAYCAAAPDNLLEASTAAVTLMGICGERAYDKVNTENLGTSSFRTYLIDEVSNMNSEKLLGGMKVETI